MKKTTIYILTLTAVVITSIYYAINRKTVPTQNLTNELRIFTDSDEEKKDLTYFNSLIENAVIFEGRIKKIKLNKGTYTLFVYSDSIDDELICVFQLDQNKKVNYLKKGDLISIKGIYKGFLKNMIFQNCILN